MNNIKIQDIGKMSDAQLDLIITLGKKVWIEAIVPAVIKYCAQKNIDDSSAARVAAVYYFLYFNVIPTRRKIDVDVISQTFEDDFLVAINKFLEDTQLIGFNIDDILEAYNG